jgi:hypothetical protein
MIFHDISPSDHIPFIAELMLDLAEISENQVILRTCWLMWAKALSMGESRLRTILVTDLDG